MTRFDHLVCACAQGLCAAPTTAKTDAEFAQFVVNAAEAIEALLVARENVRHGDVAVASRVPSDPSDLEQRERMKPGTIQRVIDAALDALLVPADDWNPRAFAERFGLSLHDAEALRVLFEAERPTVLRWLFRTN